MAQGVNMECKMVVCSTEVTMSGIAAMAAMPIINVFKDRPGMARGTKAPVG